ncbi:hypothetical protein ACFLWX_04230 [Chloroflexota bacterium]
MITPSLFFYACDGPGWIRTNDQPVMSYEQAVKLLKKIPGKKIVQAAGISESYVSQVRNGKRPPSRKMIEALERLGGYGSRNRTPEWQNALESFIKSRREGISPNTIKDYRMALTKALRVLGLTPSTADINDYLKHMSYSLGGKYCYFKNIRAFYNWLYSPRSGWNYRPEANPVTWVDAPKRPKLILPSLTKEQVHYLIDISPCVRGKAIIAMFAESGLRLSELVNIKERDID